MNSRKSLLLVPIIDLQLYHLMVISGDALVTQQVGDTRVTSSASRCVRDLGKLPEPQKWPMSGENSSTPS